MWGWNIVKNPIWVEFVQWNVDSTTFVNTSPAIWMEHYTFWDAPFCALWGSVSIQLCVYVCIYALWLPWPSLYISLCLSISRSLSDVLSKASACLICKRVWYPRRPSCPSAVYLLSLGEGRGRGCSAGDEGCVAFDGAREAIMIGKKDEEKDSLHEK